MLISFPKILYNFKLIFLRCITGKGILKTCVRISQIIKGRILTRLVSYLQSLEPESS